MSIHSHPWRMSNIPIIVSNGSLSFQDVRPGMRVQINSNVAAHAVSSCYHPSYPLQRPCSSSQANFLIKHRAGSGSESLGSEPNGLGDLSVELFGRLWYSISTQYPHCD
jgi:hypothetical protein